MTAGYWQANYWPNNYWPERYWQEYGAGDPLITIGSITANETINIIAAESEFYNITITAG
jgi:hypothetical protein